MAFTEQLNFSDLVKMLEAVSTTKVIKKRDQYMSEYFEKLHKFREEFRSKNKDLDSSTLPVMRCIMAQEEKERAYGIQEKTLRHLLIKALKLCSADAVTIKECSVEDLPDKILEVMKYRASTEGKLTIHEIDQTLTRLSENHKAAFQENELRRIILNSNALDLKWFCKMILKKMNLLIGTTKILKFYHPQAHALFLKYNHLSRVVELVESGKAEEAMIEITEVFQPIRSMLCQKFTPSLNKSFLQKDMFQETKMDGDRFQMHMKDGVFKYFSRNSHEFSEGFNELITPLVQFTSVVHSVILDGEMLVYDKIQRHYRVKGDTPVDVKHMKGIGSDLRPCYCVFDVLLYNDQSFLNRPYSERFQLLQQLFKDREGVMVKTTPIKIRDVDHMVELFNIAMEHGEEGIVIKDAESIYKPGDRSGGWYKVKPDYFDKDVVKEFDCIIIGGYYENQYTQNFIQKYMVGAIEKTEDGTFNVYAVGEVVHGLTVQERSQLNASMKPHFMEHFGESEINFGTGKIFFGQNKPHVWIPPNKSVVLEIRVSELARASEQYTEYTFRFPRIKLVRRDKIWDESCTMKEFLDVCKGNGDGRVQKIVQRKVNADDIVSPKRKKKPMSKASIIEQFLRHSDDEEELEIIDNVLEGKQFCVLTTNPKLPTIKEMTKIVRRHGGNISKYPIKGKTFAIIAGEKTISVQRYINDKCYNVIKADWLISNFGGKGEKPLKEMPKIRPVGDLYFATDALKETFKDSYDEYGDSFTDKIESVEELKILMDSMKAGATKRRKFSDTELAEFDAEMCSVGTTNINFFRGIHGAFFTMQQENFLFETSKSVLEFHAGKIIKLEAVESDEKQMIFIDKQEGIEKIRKSLVERGVPTFRLFDFNWIFDSSDAGKVLEKDEYRA